MRGRPLIFCVPAAAAALYFAASSGVSVDLRALLFLLALLLALLAFSLGRPALCTVLCVLLSAAAALAYLSVYDMAAVFPVRSLAGQTRTVDAFVCRDAVVYDDRQRAELRIDSGAEVSRPFRTLCYLPLTDKPLQAGDTVTAAVDFYVSGKSDGFDRAAYQAADGCYIASSYAAGEDGQAALFSYARASDGSLPTLPQRAARSCKQAIARYFPQREGGFLTGLLLGDKSGLSETDAVSLRKAGLSHLTAVSGLHVGFLVALCFLLFGRKAGTILSVVLIGFFVPMAGATPSAVRAGIMYLVSAGAFCLKKEADSLNSLFLALLILLLGNPHAIGSLSLQLSFSATLGLILLSGRMQRRLLAPVAKRPRLLRRLCGVVAGALSCSVCALLFTTPILLSAFGYVSVLSLLSNLLAVGVTAVCFLGGLLFCAAAGLGLPFAAPLAHFLLAPLRLLLAAAQWVASLPFGLIYWGDGFGLAALFVFFGAVLVWLLLGNRVRWRIALPGVCMALAVLTGLGVYYKQTHYLVTYLPCGAGQAIVVSCGQEEMALIDCGGDGYRNAADEVREWMQWNDFSRIDTLICTAVDLGHARDLPALLAQTEVGRVVVPQGCKRGRFNGALLDLLDSLGTRVTRLGAEQRVCQALPVTAFPIADGKLGVDIGTETLVLHSPTQKQLAAYLGKTPREAKTVVLSQKNLSDLDLLRQTFAVLCTEQVVLQTGAEPMAQLDGIPVQSTYQAGEIRRYYRKE